MRTLWRKEKVIEQAALNEQIREEEWMRNRLEHFHSPQVVEVILKGDQVTKGRIMDPKDFTATVLFMDIVAFTNLSERIPAPEITILLNHFFSKMTDITFQYHRTHDKYIWGMDSCRYSARPCRSTMTQSGRLAPP